MDEILANPADGTEKMEAAALAPQSIELAFYQAVRDKAFADAEEYRDRITKRIPNFPPGKFH